MQVTLSELLNSAGQQGSLQQHIFQQRWTDLGTWRQRHSQFQQQLDQLVASVIPRLQPGEQQLAESYHQLVDKQLAFYGKRSLNLWQRQALKLWIEQHFAEMQQLSLADPGRLQQQMAKLSEVTAELNRQLIDSHPGAVDASQVEQVDAAQQEALTAFLKRQQRAYQRFARKQQQSAQFDFFTEQKVEAFAEQQAEDLQRFGKVEQPTVDTGQSTFSEQNADQSYYSTADEAEFVEPQSSSAKLKALLDGANINTLFRKLAKVLHPDRERDPELQRQKQELMSQASNARESGDILTIFALYAEYVSDQELLFDEVELASLNELLEQQIEELKQQYDDVPYQTPQHQKVYEQFYDQYPAQVESNVQRYLNELAEDLAKMARLVEQLDSLRSLKPYLQLLWDMQQQPQQTAS